MKRLLSFLILLPALWACNEEVTGLVTEQGYDFFPLAPGHFRIYEVEEILYTGAVADSNHYFLKETIRDSIVSNDGTVTYLLERHKRADASQAFQLDSVWTIRCNNYQGIVVENNIPLVKISFPVKEDRSWDGNALNARTPLMLSYEGVENYSLLTQEISADDVVRVIIEDIPANLVKQDQRSEIYVRGIGLTEKNYVSVSFCQNACSPEQIENGRIYRQHLIEYGRE